MLELGFFRKKAVKLIRQAEFAECGLACVTMIAKYHGLDVDIGTMRRRFSPSMRGATLRSLIELSHKIGMVPRAIKLPLDEIGSVRTPAILHWNMNHYVVLERVSGRRAKIHDPGGRSRWLKIDEVSKSFTGVALELDVGLNFKPEVKHERLHLRQFWSKIDGSKRALSQILILSVLLEFFSLINPYYIQIIVDKVIPSQDYNLMTSLATGFILLNAFSIVTTYLRSFVMLFAGTSLGFGMATNVAKKMFELPIEWFLKRHTGDILSRFQSVLPIQQILTTGAIAVLVDGALAAFTLVFMLVYNKTLTLIALSTFFLYALIKGISFSLQRNAQEDQIIAGGEEQTTFIESLHGMTTLRLSGSEMLRHAHWQSKLVTSVNANAHISRISIWQSAANNVLFSIENIISIMIAARFVMDGTGFSVGMIFAYTAYKGQFLQAGSRLIDQVAALRMTSLHLERIADIALSDSDPSFILDDNENILVGRIEARNISYRYSPSDPLVLSNVNMAVEAGDHLAITGPSGGGKSTLIKILTGLVQPEGGEIIIDGRPLASFGYKSFHRQIAAVLQEDNLFSGSLADNIGLFDDKVDMEMVIEASLAASIHDDILKMPMQYETLVGDMGSTLSGGQKQRVLLARALYRRPKILFIDEGTSHLDVFHENAVNRSIKALGITRIVVAHRRETVEAAERVLVMNDSTLSPAA